MPPSSLAAARRSRTTTADRTASDRKAVDRKAVAGSVDSIRRLLRALRVAARDTLAKAGVSAAQLYVLSCLADVEEASLSELGERTMTDRTSVTAVVERLLESGFVTKRTSKEDRRRAAVRITTKGRTVLRRAPRPPTALLIDGLEALEPTELRQLERGLRALTRAMGVDVVPAEMLFEDGVESSSRAGSR